MRFIAHSNPGKEIVQDAVDDFDPGKSSRDSSLLTGRPEDPTIESNWPGMGSAERDKVAVGLISDQQPLDAMKRYLNNRSVNAASRP